MRQTRRCICVGVCLSGVGGGFEQVNDEVANVLVAQLLYLANDDPEKDITLYINSPGGSVSAGMAIYDAMQVFAGPFTMYLSSNSSY